MPQGQDFANRINQFNGQGEKSGTHEFVGFEVHITIELHIIFYSIFTTFHLHIDNCTAKMVKSIRTRA